MYSIYDCNNTFFGGHSRLIKETASFEEAVETVRSSSEDLRIYDSVEAELYLSGEITHISSLD